MTVQEWGAIGEILGALAVLATLIYLSVQIRQGNLRSKSQARERMIEQAQFELHTLMNDDSISELFIADAPLEPSDQAKLNFFLAQSMRQREWEWFQYQDRTIDQDVYEAYHIVILIQLGNERGGKWWNSIGKVGFSPDFVSSVDSLLQNSEPSSYFSDIRQWDG